MLNRLKIIVMFIQPTAHVRYVFSSRISRCWTHRDQKTAPQSPEKEKRRKILHGVKYYSSGRRRSCKGASRPRALSRTTAASLTPRGRRREQKSRGAGRVISERHTYLSRSRTLPIMSRTRRRGYWPGSWLRQGRTRAERRRRQRR